MVFNNNDCAEDTTLRNADGSWAFRNSRFYPAYPGYDWGILAGWAWGVSRIADYLETDRAIDRARLTVTGASSTSAWMGARGAGGGASAPTASAAMAAAGAKAWT